MIQANELRIGNYLQSPKGKTFEVLAHDIVFVDGCESLAEPIPITEEWLLKFGFENISSKNTLDYWIVGENPYMAGEPFFHIKHQIGNNNYFFMNIGYCIKYVHQLQNQYFALTGSELVLSTVPEATKPAL